MAPRSTVRLLTQLPVRALVKTVLSKDPGEQSCLHSSLQLLILVKGLLRMPPDQQPRSRSKTLPASQLHAFQVRQVLRLPMSRPCTGANL